MKFNTRFDTPRRVYSSSGKESLTEPQFAEMSKIDNILKMYSRSGQPLPESDVQVDLSAMPAEYDDALNLVNDVETAFNAVPADVRRNQYNDDIRAFLNATYKSILSPEVASQPVIKADGAATGVNAGVDLSGSASAASSGEVQSEITK